MLRLGYHGTFFYLRLANHSAVRKLHPTEGAEIYASCGIPACCKVCCAVCTRARRSVLVVAHPACALFFRCRDFDFSNGHDNFLRNKPNAYEHIHPPYVPHMTGAYLALGKNPGGERFLYSARIHTVQLSSPSRSMCGVNFSTTWQCVFDPYTHDNN